MSRIDPVAKRTSLLTRLRLTALVLLVPPLVLGLLGLATHTVFSGPWVLALVYTVWVVGLVWVWRLRH